MSAAAPTPDVDGFVVGYRVWRLRVDGALVSAGAGATTWTRGVNTAACQRRRHHAPAERCSCGLYAMHNPPPAASPGIVGVVRAHGDLQAQRDGFRAEHAEVVALVKRRPRATACERRAAARYGVALVHLRELEHVAAEHGAPLDTGHRPATPQRWVADMFPAVGRADSTLARRYEQVAGRLRSRAFARALALRAVEWVALAALLSGAYAGMSAIAGRSTSTWLVGVIAAAFTLTAAVTAARRRYGSGWLAPLHPWRDRAVAATGIPIALLAPGRLDADVVDALGWTVCWWVALMLLGELVWHHRPRAVAVTAAWVAAAGIAVAAGAPVVLVAAAVGGVHTRGNGTS